MATDEIRISPSGDISLTINGQDIDCTRESDWYTDDWRGIAAQVAAEHGYRIVGNWWEAWKDVEDPGTFYHGCRARIEAIPQAVTA